MAGLDDNLNSGGGNEALEGHSTAPRQDDLEEIPAPAVSVVRLIATTKETIQDTLERYSDVPNLQYALQQLKRLGINIEPLRSRLNRRSDTDLSDVYDHVHEYVRALLHALKLVEQRCGILHGIHTDQEMSDAAVLFARKLLQDPENVDGSTRVALEDFDLWLKDVRDFSHFEE